MLQHISGNVAADAAADEGTSAHNIPVDVRLEAEDREQLAIAVQNHLVASWAQWIRHSKGAAVDANHNAVITQLLSTDSSASEDFFDEIMMHNNEDFEEEDVFGAIDAIGNDIGMRDDTWQFQSSPEEVKMTPAQTVATLKEVHPHRRWNVPVDGATVIFHKELKQEKPIKIASLTEMHSVQEPSSLPNINNNNCLSD